MEDPAYAALQDRLSRTYTKAALQGAHIELTADERVMGFLFKNPNKKVIWGEELQDPKFARRMAAVILAFEKTIDPEKDADPMTKMDAEFHYEYLIQQAETFEADEETVEFAMDAVREYARKLKRGGYTPD